MGRRSALLTLSATKSLASTATDLARESGCLLPTPLHKHPAFRAESLAQCGAIVLYVG